VETLGGERVQRSLDLSVLSKEDLDRDFLGKLGLRPFRPAVPAAIAVFTFCCACSTALPLPGHFVRRSR